MNSWKYLGGGRVCAEGGLLCFGGVTVLALTVVVMDGL